MHRMLDDARLMTGQKTTEQIRLDQSKLPQDVDPEDINANKLPLPAEKFMEYKDLSQDQEEEFDYFVGSVLLSFIDKFNDKAVEFPPCLDSNGRARIHSICNFLGMASHSQGSGKTRKIIAYPRHLFKQRQEKEVKALEKERQKIKDKLEGANFAPMILENPVSARDIMMKEIWHEIKGLPKPKSDLPWDGPTEMRVAELKKKLQAYETKVTKLKDDYEAKHQTVVPAAA